MAVPEKLVIRSRVIEPFLEFRIPCGFRKYWVEIRMYGKTEQVTWAYKANELRPAAPGKIASKSSVPRGREVWGFATVERVFSRRTRKPWRVSVVALSMERIGSSLAAHELLHVVDELTVLRVPAGRDIRMTTEWREWRCCRMEGLTREFWAKFYELTDARPGRQDRNRKTALRGKGRR